MRELMEPTAKSTLIACIAFSILGIALITAFDYDYKGSVNTINISEIDRKMAGENIIACGIVKSKSVSQSGTTFLTLADRGSKTQFISLVFFKNEMHEIENISRGENVCAKGVVQIYNGSAEIIGRKIINETA